MAGLAANATAAGMNLAQLGLANLVLPNAAGTTALEDINGVAGTGAFREPTPPAGGLPFPFASTLVGFLADPEKQQQQQLMMQLLQPDDKEPEGEEQLQQLQQLQLLQQQQQRSSAVEVGENANGGGGDDEDTVVASTQFLCVLGMLSSDMLVDDEEYEAVSAVGQIGHCMCGSTVGWGTLCAGPGVYRAGLVLTGRTWKSPVE